MKKLLHIIATPRGEESRTLKVSKSFLTAFKEKYPDAEIEELDLFKDPLPEIALKEVTGKYVLLSGGKLEGELKDAWDNILKHIDQFTSQDAYLISTPMWNFGIPYKLKQYVDIIVQPGYLFKYNERGVEGLVKNKKMTVITSRGGDYSEESPMHAYDQLEPYLRTVFGFIGITDPSFINAQPMDALGPEIQATKITEAQKKARMNI
ncbi:MAG: NAD(P)H-dependent oxidoreductase [Candidatus Omnitrophota bacterium]